MHPDAVREDVCKSIAVSEVLGHTDCRKLCMFPVLPSDEMLYLWLE
jgi:hypothetical protein